MRSGKNSCPAVVIFWDFLFDFTFGWGERSRHGAESPKAGEKPPEINQKCTQNRVGGELRNWRLSAGFFQLK
jgi:hypothetical protein